MNAKISRLVSILTLSEPAQGHFWEDVLHALGVGIVLVMGLSMAFDGRYLNFEMGTLAIITTYYELVYVATPRNELNGLHEKVAGLALFISALAVLIQESARNDFAFNWVVLMLLMGSTLWLSPVCLCNIKRTLIILILSAVAIVALKEGIYVKESWIDVCVANPLLAVCKFRTILGTVIYQNYIGLTGLVVAIFSVLGGSYWLGMVAMIMGLFCLLTFNGFLGAIIVVLGWWIVGYRLGETCER